MIEIILKTVNGKTDYVIVKLLLLGIDVFRFVEILLYFWGCIVT
jgi:hypothetical protein